MWHCGYENSSLAQHLGSVMVSFVIHSLAGVHSDVMAADRSIRWKGKALEHLGMEDDTLEREGAGTPGNGGRSNTGNGAQ